MITKDTVWTIGTPVVAGPIKMVVVGHCPHCGAPIWGPENWMGQEPPAVYYACECRHAEGEMFEMVAGECPQPPCHTFLDLCPETDEYKGNSAFHDVVVGMMSRCDLACEGDWDLALCGKHPLIEDEETASPLPKYIEALGELRKDQSANPRAEQPWRKTADD